MKKLFTLLATTLVITAISAQKVEVEGDKVMVDGTEYAVIKKTSSGLEAAEYSLQTTDGEEVAIAKVDRGATTTVGSNTGYYMQITFMGSGNQASMLYTLTFKKTLAKEIVKCKLFEGGKYNADGEKKFMILNPFKPQGDAKPATTVVVNTGGSTQNYTMVDRNRNAMVQIFGEDIKQDFKDIGTVKKSTTATGGDIVYSYNFYLPDGTEVASASITGISGNSATIITLKDNRRHTVAISSNINAPKEIAKYLATNYYL